MKRTGAWLAVHALEQVGIRYTFGIPGVHNTELYDELNNSDLITPLLVTHEGGGAFMADAFSRLSDSVGALMTVPAAGLTNAASGIGEAFLDGVPMLVLCGGVRTDTPYRFQLHQMDQHQFMKGITKATFLVTRHEDIVPTIYRAYDIATQGKPGPVFVEIPVNLQLFTAEVPNPPAYTRPAASALGQADRIAAAAAMLASAQRPGLFLGWGARDSFEQTRELAEWLQAPVATTMQGLSVFPANHPLHAGFGFGAAAVPSARNAFKECDCLVAVGTRFSEIATGSYGIEVPENLIHIDIDPEAFNVNYPAKAAICGDSAAVLDALLAQMKQGVARREPNHPLQQQIRQDKQAYRATWYEHDSKGRVNPARFFDELRQQAPDDAVTVMDDGNHTFLTAELFPVHGVKSVIMPTDFNSMGYAVPGAIGAKLARRDVPVNCIVGDGCFLMTCMEILTATSNRLGIVYYVFHDGALSQIAQAQEIPYNRKTCTTLQAVDLSGIAKAVGAAFLPMRDSDAARNTIAEANRLAAGGMPVVVDVNIDYSKRTAFTAGATGTTFQRFPLGAKLRFLSRALMRKLTG